jgi:hypothetical protein
MDAKINAKDNEKLEEVKDSWERLAQQHACVFVRQTHKDTHIHTHTYRLTERERETERERQAHVLFSSFP